VNPAIPNLPGSRLPLQGADNFRDIGGYPAAGGWLVRRGLVFRSDSLDRLTERDRALVSRLDIKLVCDFRTGSERKPDAALWPEPQPEFFPQPIEPGVDQARVFAAIRLAPSAETSRNALLSLYRSMPVEGGPQFGALLRRLVEGDAPALYHCSAGKDRTGLFTALLLMSLGVAEEAVMRDYLLSNEYLLDSASARRLVGLMKEFLQLDGDAAAALQPFLGVEAGYLEASLDTIQRAYGGLEPYRKSVLGLGAAEVDALRKRLLE
jgi:protein-tyrosine phosphatase